VRNTGTGTENNFDITDNLSGILAFAEIVDTNGGKLRGDTITWEDVDIRRGQTVTKTFRVRIKTNLNSSQSFVLDNTYGNSVTVTVPGFSSIPFIAPKTGSSGTSAAVFAGLLTSGFVAFRKRRQLLNLIFV
jgi:LPXTG-motif cell wall-anchored protein